MIRLVALSSLRIEASRVVGDLLRDSAGHAERSKLRLDERWIVTDFEHGHCESVCSTEGIETDRWGLPFVVHPLNIERHTAQVAVGNIGNAAADGKAAVGELVRQAEHDAALHRLAER